MYIYIYIHLYRDERLLEEVHAQLLQLGPGQLLHEILPVLDPFHLHCHLLLARQRTLCVLYLCVCVCVCVCV